ncbi:Uncharacterized membrane-anchored protein [Parafrankia irregularis]|uniref:Uncharacterized membrane-anchored protein n=1 Tax=Parafrankia irregularis TaxID=795642 RepID=A0A0S4QM32_9ACTN|nr:MULTISPECIES: hypothetical protein [Parafrankia]MBE3205603.1 hypothetical protein [Parafrankia sp. CH37]CUU55498.1 Uncharacterized membrane-anchored protein [Parafrankia irregularis]
MTRQHSLARADGSPAPVRQRLSKVPEVTALFWVIKVLCTTVGESAADFLNVNLGLGLTGTSVVTGVLLVGALIVQFTVRRYVPVTYWLAVALVSVFGTLVTDNLTDNLGVPLETSTLVFGGLLGLTFLAWYLVERTLSIHSVLTARREAFYWLAVLVTFALGTATGDLMAEVLGVGYLMTGVIMVALIAALAAGWRNGLNPVLSFWLVYVLTRPLGASIGDYLSQSQDVGGLGLGATVTSLIFTAGIIVIVVYFSVTRADVIPATPATRSAAAGSGSGSDSGARPGRGGLVQTIVVVSLVLVTAGTGYFLRRSALESDTSGLAPASDQASGGGQAAPFSPLGDLSKFATITQDTLDRLNAGHQSAATSRIGDLETAWDNAEARLKPRDGAAWTAIDDRIDTALRALRSTHPDVNRERSALTGLLTDLRPQAGT